MVFVALIGRLSQSFNPIFATVYSLQSPRTYVGIRSRGKGRSRSNKGKGGGSSELHGQNLLELSSVRFPLHRLLVRRIYVRKRKRLVDAGQK